MVIQSIIQYFYIHKNAVLLTGCLTIFGTIVTSYGLINDQKIMIILGPIIASTGKLLLIGTLFLPKIISSITKKLTRPSDELL